LADNDIPGEHHFTTESFYAEPLADAVAAILNAALSFLVSHLKKLELGLFGFRAAGDAFDFHARQFAAMPDRAVITLAPLIFEGDDFFVFALLDHFGGDFTFAMGDVFAIDVHQHLERRRLPGCEIEKIDIYRVAFRDAILPSASLDNCVSHNVFPGRKSRANSHRSVRLATEKVGAVHRTAGNACAARTDWGQSPLPAIMSTISPFGRWAS